MLEHITPVILTYNEAPNIGRTLERLGWAREIVVVDSFSDDETLTIAEKFPQVRIFQRKFDAVAHQLNFGCHEMGITSEWILALDADYFLTDEFTEELKALSPDSDVGGYRSHFIYSVFGRPLRTSIYPPVTVLFRRSRGFYYQDGHTYRLRVEGEVLNLRSKIVHDDRKPLGRWVQYQNYLASLEAEKLMQVGTNGLDWVDRIRKMRIVAPFGMLVYSLFIKGLLLDGWRGIFYSLQRTYAELLLSLKLIESDLSKGKKLERS